MIGHVAALVAFWPEKAPVIEHKELWGGTELGCRLHVASPCGKIGINIRGLSSGVDIICADGHLHTGMELCVN
jgi:hypothetical protein